MKTIRFLLARLAIVAVFISATAASYAAPFAYISNQYGDTVSVIDTDTTPWSRPCQWEHPVRRRGQPRRHLRLCGESRQRDVSVIDTATNTVVATVPVGSDARSASRSTRRAPSPMWGRGSVRLGDRYRHQHRGRDRAGGRARSASRSTRRAPSFMWRMG